MGFIMALLWAVSLVFAFVGLVITIREKDNVRRQLLIPLICWMLLAGGSMFLLDTTQDELAETRGRYYGQWTELRECKAENTELQIER